MEYVYKCEHDFKNALVEGTRVVSKIICKQSHEFWSFVDKDIDD